VGPVNAEARQNEPVFQLKVKSSDQSLRLLTTTIKAMKHWAVYKDKLPLLFEVFGVLLNHFTRTCIHSAPLLLQLSTNIVSLWNWVQPGLHGASVTSEPLVV